MVPFEQLGPGQVGRLVYQVIGQDGPIFNPRRISYLSPSAQSESRVPTLSDLAVGLEAVNLAVGVGTLAVAAATWQEVRKVNEKVEHLLAWTVEADTKLNHVAECVERIDVRVAENNLRHSMQHLLRQSTNEHGVDLVRLAALAGELENFTQSCEGFLPGGNLGLRISGDVRDMLSSCCRLLHSVRTVTYQAHNRACGGEPDVVLRTSKVSDYFDSTWGNWTALVRTVQVLGPQMNKVEIVGDDIYKKFSFATAEDSAYYNGLVKDQLLVPLLDELLDPFVGNSLPVTLPFVEAGGDPEEQLRVLRGYPEWWLYGTDAGLIWRTYIECSAIREGYVEMFGDSFPHRQCKVLSIDSVDVDVSFNAATFDVLGAPGANSEGLAARG